METRDANGSLDVTGFAYLCQLLISVPLPLLMCSFSDFGAPCSFRTDIANAFPEGKGKKISATVSLTFSWRLSHH